MSSESSTQAPARPSRPPLIPALDFNPSPELAEKLLSRLVDSDFTLGSLAHIAGTSFESIALWLTRPEIAARVANLEAVMAMKVRLDVACHTPLIIHACKTIIGFYAEAMNHRFVADTNTRGHAIRAREGANAMLASRILLHLAKQYAKPAQPPRTAPLNPPAPTNAPSESNTPSERSTRFDILPRLADPILNLHDQREANLTTNPNPTRDNATESLSRQREEIPAFTSPSRERRSDDFHARDEALRIPGSEPQSTSNLAPATINTPKPAFEAESLIGNSRGLSESASVTPGKQAIESPHPVRVQPETPGKSPCACHSKSRKTKPCTSCASTPTQILISAGTTFPRETPKPTV